MNNEDQIPGAEMPEPVETNAVALRDPNMPPPEKVTATQARVEAVADALKVAYANASQLKLTPEEAKALAEDFPDEAFRLGAGGDPNLIYIEHAYLRMRLNSVLGVGAAVPIRRREWAEEFQYYKDGQRKTGIRVYADIVLVVRGCVVGESIGDAVYYPENAKTNYSDALESAKSNAFRRCCKEFGVGLQAWLKGWCEGWKARQQPAGRSGGYQRPPQPAPTQPSPQSGAKPPAKSGDVLPQEATPEQFQKFMAALNPVREPATEYFKRKGWLPDKPEAVLEELPIKHVPKTKREFDSIMAELEAWMDGEQQAPDWKSFPMPWGKNKDTPLGDLDKKYLFGLFMNFEVEEEYDGKRKHEDAIAKDRKFREMLDAVGEHYEWKRE